MDGAGDSVPPPPVAPVSPLGAVQTAVYSSLPSGIPQSGHPQPAGPPPWHRRCAVTRKVSMCSADFPGETHTFISLHPVPGACSLQGETCGCFVRPCEELQTLLQSSGSSFRGWFPGWIRIITLQLGFVWFPCWLAILHIFPPVY